MWYFDRENIWRECYKILNRKKYLKKKKKVMSGEMETERTNNQNVKKKKDWTLDYDFQPKNTRRKSKEK